MLQPVATRLQYLELLNSCLRGSADGFLTAGWTALNDLSLDGSLVKDDVLTSLNLPALERLSITDFEHRGGVLQIDQLCCPQISSPEFQLESSLARTCEGDRRCCSLLHLPQLAKLEVVHRSSQRTMDLGLPASLKHLHVRNLFGEAVVGLDWVLHEAAKCIRGGAQLRSLNCERTVASSHPEGMPWGASSLAHYRDLGAQLGGLKALYVYGRGKRLLSAIGAVACSAPALTHLKFCIEEEMNAWSYLRYAAPALRASLGVTS